MHLAYLIWIFTLAQLHCSSDFECTIDTKERVECGIWELLVTNAFSVAVVGKKRILSFMVFFQTLFHRM